MAQWLGAVLPEGPGSLARSHGSLYNHPWLQFQGTYGLFCLYRHHRQLLHKYKWRQSTQTLKKKKKKDTEVWVLKDQSINMNMAAHPHEPHQPPWAPEKALLQQHTHKPQQTKEFHWHGFKLSCSQDGCMSGIYMIIHNTGKTTVMR